MGLYHGQLVKGTAILVVMGLIACLTMSFCIDKHELISTSCGELTYNFMGTISSANNIWPVGLIWQLVIVSTVGVRLFNGYCSFRYFTWKCRGEVTFHWSLMLYIAENLFLLMVAVIPSKEYLDVHCSMFASFTICAFLHQLLRLQELRNAKKFCNDVNKTYSKLMKIFAVGSLLLFLTILFSFLHFIGCYSGAYSMFASMEYLYVVYGNVYFHVTGLRAVKELNNCRFFSLTEQIVIQTINDDPLPSKPNHKPKS